ncbi:MAG: HEAT repeat domain-containing protein, partial [Acidobacteriota bacterium]
MRRHARAIWALLFWLPMAAIADSRDDKLLREYVTKLTKERDAKDRASAAHWLGGREQPEAVAALAKALSDPDAAVRQAAASALWDTGKGASAAKPDLTKALSDRDAAVVARAAGALASMGVPDSELAEAWRGALDGARDDATAFIAARGLIGIAPPDKLAPPVLTWLAKKAEGAANPGRGRSGSDDGKSAEAASDALGHLLRGNGAAAVLPLLDETVRRTPESGRWVFRALRSLKTFPPGTVDLALAHTGSREPETRDAAISLAGKVKTEREAARWIPEAIRMLDDSNESVRMEACWVLKGVKGLSHDAAPELARLLSGDRSMKVRVRAAEALQEIGDASNPVPKAAKAAVASASKGPLTAAMKDKDHDLAMAAVGAYNVMQLDSAEIVATLAGVAMSGADIPARQRALHYLRDRQGQAKIALETIRPLTRSSDKAIADDARDAVEGIDRGGAGSPGAIKGVGPAGPAPVSRAAAESPAPRSSSTRPSGSSPSSAQSSNSAPPAGGEEKGLALLRDRNLEFNETGFYRALSEGNGEAIRAYLDGGMSAKLSFAQENRRSPLMVLFFHGQ